MPYIIDLVRLAASAALAATPDRMSMKSICTNILDGYALGLARPEAIILDRDHMWLRKRFIVDEPDRAKFWRKLEAQYQTAQEGKKHERPPARWRKLFEEALPEPGVTLTYWRHTAGTGSLGRPRWLGYGIWRSGPMLREAKALVPSGWVRAHGAGGEGARLGLNDIARGRYRAPDPWYTAEGNLLIRRLSPNNRKINALGRRDALRLLQPDLLHAMGRDLAGVHLGLGERREAIRADLAKRKRRWFRTRVEAATTFVASEFAEWKKSAK
jgi:hypothetical protein